LDRPDEAIGEYSEDELAAIQRRTLGVLFSSAIFGRAAMSIGFAVAALLIKDMLGDGTWAGSSTAAVTVGSAFSASILSEYMNRRGRRPGLSIGYVAATLGGVLAVVSGQRLILVGFLLGIALIGVGQGATNLARYAAADLAKPANRGKAISSVVFASTAGAVAGPALVGPAGRVAESVGLDELVGGYLFATVFFAVSGLILWVGLRPDPLVVAGGLRAAAGRAGGGFRSGFSSLAAHPDARLAALGLAIAQAVMVMVMAMTPLHMDAHGHGLGIIGWVISAHTAGMYAFAPMAGWASDRFGRIPVLGLGGVCLVAATAMTALAGEAPALLMFPGLFMLGLGWSFGIVAASALLTEAVPAGEQVPAQGAADFITSTASGAGALASGFVFTMAGFHVLSMLGIAGAGVMLVAAVHRHLTTAATSAASV
ncbi:MAG: MFS transporter, partial [Acidimicrobiia bacterium]|nr:MFS transporter [Acidimicrobiia bacterium]